MSVPSQDPIVVAPSPTPFRDDDSVDYQAIERNVQRWLDSSLSGFVLNSENGEEAFLSEHERLEIIRTVHRSLSGRKFIIGGIDSPSVTDTLRFADALAEAGAELIRIRIPRLASNVRDYFFEIVPRAALPIVLIHQMAPGQFLNAPAAIGAPAELIGEIVAMDNVFGYIMSDNLRFESRVRTLIPKEKKFWVSNGSLLLPGTVAGANGGCMMLANVAPQACHDVIELAIQGELDRAQAIQTRILEMDWQILSRGAAGIKAALNLMGFEAGAPRSPSMPCDDNGLALIREAMKKADLIH
jgi:4-hydroxy-2-oxoglutarate aldolase